MAAELQGVGVEYQGNPVPICRPNLYGVGVEYRGNPVPICRPNPHGVGVEYRYAPLTTGILGPSGVPEHAYSKSTQTNIELVSRIAPADLLAIATVSSSAPHDAESKWRYLLVQYLNRATGEVFNIVHRKVGANWDGKFFFPATISLGNLAKRSVIVVAKSGPQLVLLPTEFTVSESIHILP